MDYQVWPLLKEYLAGGERILEVGPGYQPRVPLRSSYFIDIDPEVVEEFGKGGKALVGSVEDLPYQSEIFDLICAFDVLEHVERDEEALAEIHRVLKKDGIFVFSVPLFEEYWSRFDELTGHKRHYHPPDLEATLGKVGFGVEKFLCPRNLLAFLFERRFTWVIICLQLIRDFCLMHVSPSYRIVLYKLYARTPLNRMRGLNQVSWERGHLAEIKNRWSVIVVCRKA